VGALSMTSRSRVWLFCIFCLFMICAGAIPPAAGNKDGRKSLAKHGRKRLCQKKFPGCKTCSGAIDEGRISCDDCASSKADFDGEGCVCIGEYGTLTRSQYLSAWKKAKKDHKGTKHLSRYGKTRKHAGKHGKRCVRCEKYDLVAEEGICSDL